MVVFQDGQPRRNDYRKFRIKSVQGPNDYASMEEVLTRRFTHGMQTDAGGFDRFPDLIMMDGGRGQVNIALGVLEKLNLHIPVYKKRRLIHPNKYKSDKLYYKPCKIKSINSFNMKIINQEPGKEKYHHAISKVHYPEYRICFCKV